jgi:hypothetical protein
MPRCESLTDLARSRSDTLHAIEKRRAFLMTNLRHCRGVRHCPCFWHRRFVNRRKTMKQRCWSVAGYAAVFSRVQTVWPDQRGVRRQRWEIYADRGPRRETRDATREDWKLAIREIVTKQCLEIRRTSP